MYIDGVNEMLHQKNVLFFMDLILLYVMVISFRTIAAGGGL